MKIFSAAQIRACDAYTIHATPISSISLMERASEKCVQWLTHSYGSDTPFVVVCGTGNNGGDGLAITRLLHLAGYQARAFLLQFSDDLSADCKVNLERLRSIAPTQMSILPTDTYLTDINEHIVIIDAILGSGLNRPLEGWLANFIEHINLLPNRKISIDIPSGLPADTIPAEGTAIIQANDTLSFQFYKRSFLHRESGIFAGNVHILDINLSETFINATFTQYKTIDTETIASMYKRRSPFAHKGDFGHLLLIGGSYGKMGAMALAAAAAVRSGAGLTTVLVPACGYVILQSVIPEAMCITSGDTHIGSVEEWQRYHAIGIGPGMGTHQETADAFADFLEQCSQPIVVDADALNLLALQPDLLTRLPGGSILTPHPREFERLFGTHPNSMLQVDHARNQAMRYNLNIVLKGHHTAVITTEGECWYNMTGNSGMARGGSGDVLTGFITGLLAQGYEPQQAAILGVFLHGKAGDIAAAKMSQQSMTPGDLVNNLGQAFLTL